MSALREYAISRSLFRPATLPSALRRMGYVQADPIRAPSRAQDLILRHRVKGYRDGDLERRYPRLPIEEDALINYGFVHRDLHALLHPRVVTSASRVERSHPGLMDPILAFVRANGPTHPRDLDLEHGGKSLENYWGGNSSAATHALDMLHYKGMLRVVKRIAGIRVYASATHHPSVTTGAKRDDAADRDLALRIIERIVGLYAPVPRRSFQQLASMLRYGAPQLDKQVRDRGLLGRALNEGRLRSVRVDDADWIVPAVERIRGEAPATVKLLAPFDPVVWDRRRFELFWRWPYRFEAYTPLLKRKLGYYAMPLLWRESVIGWGNVKAQDGRLHAEIGFAGKRPRDATFTRELEAEMERFGTFLGTGKIARVVFRA